MTAKKSIFLVMGSHLFPTNFLPSSDQVDIVMIEDVGLCTHFDYHKKKLVLFLEAMRCYADLLSSEGYTVHYSLLGKESESFEFVLSQHCQQLASDNIESFEIEDRFFRSRLQQFFDKKKLRWTAHPSPMFLNSTEVLQDEFGVKKHPRLRPFYESERKKRNILMQGDEPAGGQFSYDHDNRRRLPKKIAIPPLPTIKPTSHHHDVCQIVNQLFKHHPGETDGCWIPVTRADAKKWLEVFLQERLAQFGTYEDALSTKEAFIFHSTLSPLLNIGLLTPQEVIDKALQQTGVPLNSIEGFVRQILGWREFIRGIDEVHGSRQEDANFFQHTRRLNPAWWTGDTGLLPVDHCIRKALRYGYCHHIERLMILSNVMLLLEIHPKEAYRWFMEMFVDSADWVMGPNVFGMGLFSDGGIFATKPYICGSNYLRKMGDFPKGEWCDVFDGLYWRFIDRRRTFFQSQPRLNMMLRTLDRMSDERKQHLFSVATAFQERVTVEGIA